MKFLSPVVPLAVLPLLVQAHAGKYAHHNVIPRQASATGSDIAPPSQIPDSAGAAPSTDSFVLSLTSINPTALPLSAIVSTAQPAPTQEVSPIYPQGAVPPNIIGAPPLPDDILQKDYPTPDDVPPVNSAEVEEWIREVANSGVPIPDIPINLEGGCTVAGNAVAAADTDRSRCWWTCTGCTRKTDITQCPQKGTFGLSFDDGPAPYTPDLLDFLDQQKLKATFFVVGSRVYYRPDLLRKQYMEGHQIAVHTWSHPELTTLTNEQIIAELGWSRRVIQDTLGVTPNMMRPPYGDIDDRVRAISVAMGLTPVIWTQGFDTEDFEIGSGGTTVQQSLQNWERITAAASTSDKGFIVLEHDLFQQTVELATGYILPDAIGHNYTIQPIVTCMGLPLNDAYMETNNNQTHPDPAQGAQAIFTGPTKALLPPTHTPASASGPGTSTSPSNNVNKKNSNSARAVFSVLGMGATSLLAGLISILA
ncbi:glycoside hydrolase/deacetylase [Pluteus cervinus]|uniref:Glycoside hydrolase/deacetylase n=1 Tax=Pluteus cervinus TaxID=181527 RepID=A0ACD3AS23_9AGAR|nr:glycoside hydrolase/deacetylase [Pluteus cervinus]